MFSLHNSIDIAIAADLAVVVLPLTYLHDTVLVSPSQKVSMPGIATFCRELDELLTNGIPLGEVTEICEFAGMHVLPC